MGLFENKTSRSIIYGIILLMGLFIRIYEIANWKLYSDSFKFLLIAKSIYYGRNIIEFYPQSDFSNFTTIYSLYKWLYGIVIGYSVKLTDLINVTGLLTVTIDNSIYELWGHIWVVLPSVLCILLVGSIAYEITKSRQFAFIASLLLTFSGATIIWNSFIVTEPITIFLFLLLILWDLKYSNLFLNLILGFLVGLARPEFFFVVAIYIVLSFILRRYSFKAVSKTFLHLINKGAYLIMGLTYIYVFLFSSLFKTNLYGDLFIFISTLLICVFAVIDSNKGEVDVIGLNADPLWLVVSKINWILLVVIIFLTLRYYTFNDDIERYVVVIIPLLILLNVNYWYLKFNTINWKVVSLGLTIVVISQFIYVISFNKYKSVDYHTELARKVINIARNNHVTNIYVAQSDPFVYEDTYEDIHIYKLSNDSFETLLPNSLVVKDPSLPYRNVIWKNNGLELFDKFTTEVAFKANGVESVGDIELWRKN